MSVNVTLEISKKDVEVLAQGLEECSSCELEDFIQKVLRKTNETTAAMIKSAADIRAVNPFSMCCDSFCGGTNG